MKSLNPHMDALTQEFLQEASDLITKNKIDLEGLDIESLFLFVYNNEERCLKVDARKNLSDRLLGEAQYIIQQLKTN